jgi:hypothetical protein
MEWMNTYTTVRSMGWLAALIVLTLFSGRASAAVITDWMTTIDGFANNGSLTIEISGNSDSGDADLLEFPPPGEVTEFMATYTDDGTLGTMVWDLITLQSLLFDTITNTLQSATALFIPPFDPTLPPAPALQLEFGVGVGLNPTSTDLVEIYQVTPFGGQLIASAPPPSAGVPLPGTLALVGLGLLVLRRGVRRSL